MNIQSTQARPMTVRAQQQQLPTQPPAQQQPEPPKDSFHQDFSTALETTVPLYTAAVSGLSMGAAGILGGATIGALVGGVAGAVAGSLFGAVGAGYMGMLAGDRFGQWAMQESGRIGAAHSPENPAEGKAIGQALAAGAITMFTGSPVMTALVVGGSAAYAAHNSAVSGGA